MLAENSNVQGLSVVAKSVQCSKSLGQNEGMNPQERKRQRLGNIREDLLSLRGGSYC